MAYDLIRGLKSIPANHNFQTDTNYTTGQYTFVKLDSTGALVQCGSGQLAISVIQDTPNVGEPGACCSPGDITKIMCNGTVNAGEAVMCDSTGAAVPSTSGASTLGWALAAGAAGSMTEIVFQPGS